MTTTMDAPEANEAVSLANVFAYTDVQDKRYGWRRSFADEKQLSITRKGPYSFLARNELAFSGTDDDGNFADGCNSYGPEDIDNGYDEYDTFVDGDDGSGSERAPSLAFSPSTQGNSTPGDCSSADSIFPSIKEVDDHGICTVERSLKGPATATYCEVDTGFPKPRQGQILNRERGIYFPSMADNWHAHNFSEESTDSHEALTHNGYASHQRASFEYDMSEPTTPGTFRDRRLKSDAGLLRDQLVSTMRVNRNSLLPHHESEWELPKNSVSKHSMPEVTMAQVNMSKPDACGSQMQNPRSKAGALPPRKVAITETSTSPFVKRWIYSIKNSKLPNLSPSATSRKPNYLIPELRPSRDQA